jgi:hypothetical protein
MKIEMLKSRIRRATLTGADLEYTGSVSVGEALTWPLERFRPPTERLAGIPL